MVVKEKLNVKKEYIIYYTDYNGFIKQIPKLRWKAREHIIGLNYQGKTIFNDKEFIHELKDIPSIITTLNIKNKRKRYEYIYDVVCNYIDNEFKENNYCDFINNQCIYYRNQTNKEHINGCCFSYKKGLLCEYFNNGCTIKSMGCKFHVCKYLKKQGITFKIDDFPLLKYFFNTRQKVILRFSFFTDKEEVINKLVKLI